MTPQQGPSGDSNDAPSPGPSSRSTNKRTYTTSDCEKASTTGQLTIFVAGGSNAGGPNYVPTQCSAIYLQLTAIEYITHARACAETDSGTTLYCGSWVYLKDRGAWNRLLDNVHPGERWKLQMTGDEA